MTDRCPRTVAVAGLPGTRISFAVDCLQRRGVLVESFLPTAEAIDDLLKRGVLLIWIESPLSMRLGRSKWRRTPVAEQDAMRAEETEQRQRALKAKTGADGELNLFYAWRMAQVVVHDNGGSFMQLMTGLARRLTGGSLTFMSYSADLVLRTDGEVGRECYQLLVLGGAVAGQAA